MNKQKQETPVKKTLFTSLTRSRRQFAVDRAQNVAIEASEEADDYIKDLKRQIRRQRSILVRLEDDQYVDELALALKRAPEDYDVKKQIVIPRFQALVKLRNLIIELDLIERDGYFTIPDDIDTTGEKMINSQSDDDANAATINEANTN